MIADSGKTSEQEVYRIMQSEAFDYLFGETYSALIKKRDEILKELQSYESRDKEIVSMEYFPDPEYMYQCNISFGIAVLNVLYYKKLNMRKYIPPERLCVIDEMCNEIIDIIKNFPQVSYFEIISLTENKGCEEALEILIEQEVIRNTYSPDSHWNWHINKKYKRSE